MCLPKYKDMEAIFCLIVFLAALDGHTHARSVGVDETTKVAKVQEDPKSPTPNFPGQATSTNFSSKVDKKLDMLTEKLSDMFDKENTTTDVPANMLFKKLMDVLDKKDSNAAAGEKGQGPEIQAEPEKQPVARVDTIQEAMEEGIVIGREPSLPVTHDDPDKKLSGRMDSKKISLLSKKLMDAFDSDDRLLVNADAVQDVMADGSSITRAPSFPFLGGFPNLPGTNGSASSIPSSPRKVRTAKDPAVQIVVGCLTFVLVVGSAVACCYFTQKRKRSTTSGGAIRAGGGGGGVISGGGLASGGRKLVQNTKKMFVRN